MKLKQLKLIVILFAQLLTIMDIFIINVAIPSVQESLDASNGEMQLIIAAYLIGFASFLIIGSRMGDYFGRKKIFIIGLGCFMLSSVLSGFSPNAYVLVIARFFQGTSAALMSPQVLSYIQVLFTEQKERIKAMSLYGVIIGIGTILGQFLGGYFSSLNVMDESWRMIFFINIPICLLAIGFGNYCLTESKMNITNRFDIYGVVFLTLGLLCFTYPLTVSEGKTNRAVISSLLFISVGFLSYFFRSQKSNTVKNKPFLINFSLFRYRNFIIGILSASFFFIMLDSYFYILSVYFQDGLKLTPLYAGEAVVFQGIGFIFSSFFSGKLILRFGKIILIWGLLLIMVVLGLQAILFTSDVSKEVLYVLLFIHGVGVGTIIPSLANIAFSELPESLAGNASGVYNTIQQVASMLGIVLVGGLFYQFVGKQSFGEYQTAFKIGIGVNLVCLCCVLILILKIPNDVFPKESNF